MKRLTSRSTRTGPRFPYTTLFRSPYERRPDKKVLKWAAERQGQIRVTSDPAAAVGDAACVITDTGVSMGMKDAERRHAILKPFQVNAGLMGKAAEEIGRAHV